MTFHNYALPLFYLIALIPWFAAFNFARGGGYADHETRTNNKGEKIKKYPGRMLWYVGLAMTMTFLPFALLHWAYPALVGIGFILAYTVGHWYFYDHHRYDKSQPDTEERLRGDWYLALVNFLSGARSGAKVWFHHKGHPVGTDQVGHFLHRLIWVSPFVCAVIWVYSLSWFWFALAPIYATLNVTIYELGYRDQLWGFHRDKVNGVLWLILCSAFLPAL